MKFRHLIVLACAFTMSGCALTEDTVSVPYTAQGGPQLGAGVKVTTAVVDARTPDRARISAKVNGYGMEMAAIRANREVTAIVKDAFEAELRSRGYSLETGGHTATISVKRFYTSFKTGVFSGDAAGDVQFGVAVTGPDGTAFYQRDIAVIVVNANIMMASGSNAAETLTDGLKKAFTTLFSDEAFTAALQIPPPPDLPGTTAPAQTNS